MAMTSMPGGVLVTNKTIIRLLLMCAPKPLGSASTLVDVGVEQHKRDMALLLQKEFNIDLGLNNAADMIKKLTNAQT